MHHLGPYSRPDALANVDGRTREARIVRKVRADLVAHLGGNVSATQRVLIERAAALTLRLALLDAKQAKGERLTEHDNRTYLAESNALTRLMRQLGMKSAAQQPPSLRDHIAARAAAGP